MLETYGQVKDNFLTGKIKGCKDYFEKNGYYTEAGYCYIILDNRLKAAEMFNRVQNVDLRAHWALFLLEMLNDKVASRPSYFELRNFLEIDVDILITYCKGGMIEKILRYVDYMAMFNTECYKFMGRVFWANNFMQASNFFLNKAKDKLYNDPELHYLLAYIEYYNNHDLPKTFYEIDTCLRILPEYAPAKMLREKIRKAG